MTPTPTHKRDTYSNCETCYASIRQDAIGRQRRFCCAACRQRAYRQRQNVTIRPGADAGRRRKGSAK